MDFMFEKYFSQFYKNWTQIYIIISLFVCVCLTGYRLGPGGHTDMRPVSLEPVWPGGVHQGKFFENDQWRNCRRESTPLMLFCGENLKFYVYKQFSTGIHMKVIRNVFSKGYATNAFLMGKISAFCFMFEKHLFASFKRNLKRDDFYVKNIISNFKEL